MEEAWRWQVRRKDGNKKESERRHVKENPEEEKGRESTVERLTGGSRKQHLDFLFSLVKLDYSNLI